MALGPTVTGEGRMERVSGRASAKSLRQAVPQGIGRNNSGEEGKAADQARRAPNCFQNAVRLWPAVTQVVPTPLPQVRQDGRSPNRIATTRPKACLGGSTAGHRVRTYLYKGDSCFQARTTDPRIRPARAGGDGLCFGSGI